MNRSSLKNTLSDATFDAVIVGGGISGAWIAHALTEQGYRIAVLERGDFASATSSSSSKLLHGGIRYLQQLQFGKVRESTLERAHYLSTAPHLAAAVPFLVPTYKDLKRSKLVLNAGMLAYQTLGIGQQSQLRKAGVALPSTTTLSTQNLLSLCAISPDQLTGAVSFPEFHLYDSERTVWSIMHSAMKNGACVVNYANVTQLLKTGDRVTGVRVVLDEDGDNIDVLTPLVINAAGPWVDELNVSDTIDTGKASEVPTTQLGSEPIADAAKLRTIQGYATGAHMITRQLLPEHAIAITTQQQNDGHIGRGGRHIFIIPWRGCSLIGTSYRETTDPNDASVLLQEDMDQLLDSVNEAIPSAKLTAADVHSAYSGLYPLRVERIKASLYQGSGEYLIIDHAKHDQREGLVTALGAKFTTGRILGVKTVKLCSDKLSQAGIVPSLKIAARSDDTHQTTRQFPDRLHCAQYDRYNDFLEHQRIKLQHRFTDAQIVHLVRCYGSQVDAFVDFLDAQTEDYRIALEQPIMNTQPDVMGQVAWAVVHEMAIHLDDVLLRRTSLGLLGLNDDGYHSIANIMAPLLHWNSEKTTHEITRSMSRQSRIRQTVDHYFSSAAPAKA